MVTDSEFSSSIAVEVFITSIATANRLEQWPVTPKCPNGTTVVVTKSLAIMSTKCKCCDLRRKTIRNVNTDLQLIGDALLFIY